MKQQKPTTPPLRGTPPCQEGSFCSPSATNEDSFNNSPPAKGEYPARGEGVAKIEGVRLNNLPVLRTFRKELRNHLTPAEARLWAYLQRSQLSGRKFRRQHSVGRYILDFYCPAERLAIELDGAVHDSEAAQLHDAERDLFLRHCGIRVLRFENKWVFLQPDEVLAEITKHFGWQKEQP